MTPTPEQPEQRFIGADFDPELKPNPQMLALVTSLGAELAAGSKPEFLFTCGIREGMLTVQGGPKRKPTILLFMTQFAALDYLSATGLSGEVRPIRFEAVPELIQKWLGAGVGNLALDRCPRCPVMLLVDLTTITNLDKLTRLWGIRRATQICYGRVSVQRFLRAKDSGDRRAALELIRDHIDCSVPYVYELLAMVAQTDGDVPAQSAAIKALEQFGPQFANWESRWDSSSSDVWTQAMAQAYVGLCLSFGMDLSRAQQA